MRVLGIVLLSSFLASFTDWLFMDVLVHRFYLREPGLWRENEGSRRIVVSQILGTLASASCIALCWLAPEHKLMVAALAWCAGPLPVIAQNLQWMRLHASVAASHAAGWLIRLLIAALLAHWLL